MTFEKVIETMTNNGFKFGLAHLTPEGVKFAMPEMSKLSYGSSLVPMWVKSHTEHEIICILGSEPPNLDKLVTIPTSMLVSPLNVIDIPKHL